MTLKIPHKQKKEPLDLLRVEVYDDLGSLMKKNFLRHHHSLGNVIKYAEYNISMVSWLYIEQPLQVNKCELISATIINT